MLTGHYLGGMDLYVQEFGVAKTHDEFYTSMTIREEFYKYVQFVVSRYVNESGVIAWEIANDARCNSTLPSSDLCNTNTVTLWHAETAEFIRSIDSNHLITSGCASILFLPNDLLNSPSTTGPMASFVQHAPSYSRLRLHIHHNLRPLPEGLVSVLLAVSCPLQVCFS